MMLATNEPNGSLSPVPVWRSLKGLSSRDAEAVSSPSSELTSFGSWGLRPKIGDSSFSMEVKHPSRSSLPGDDYRPSSTVVNMDSIDIDTPKCREGLDIPSAVHNLKKFLFRQSTPPGSSYLSNPNFVNQRTDGPLGSDSQQDILNTQSSRTAPHVFSTLNVVHGVTSPFIDLYRHSRLGKKVRRRIIQKGGECNITKANVAKRSQRFLQDLFTTLLDIQWRWTLLVFALSFVVSWILFASIWYAIVYSHGDLLPQNLPDKQPDSGWKPCVMNIFSFGSCFLFSIETQHTIGYGSRHTTEECPEAIFVMCLQSITGVILQAFLGGVIFMKLSRPKKRTHTLIFSRLACICQRDGSLCLLFRVGDMRKSHIIEAHIRVLLITEKVTDEGEAIPFHHYELDVGYDGGEDRILFIWPMTIVHKIDEDSPLFEVSAHDLSRAKFEIIVMLEGVIENTGMTIQARSSYLPSEIRWGYSFCPMLTFRDDIGDCAVDYSLFNETYEVSTPLCSAKYLQEVSSASSAQVTPSTSMTTMVAVSPSYASNDVNDNVSPQDCPVGGLDVKSNKSSTPRGGRRTVSTTTDADVVTPKGHQESSLASKRLKSTDHDDAVDLHRVRGCNSRSRQPILAPLGEV